MEIRALRKGDDREGFSSGDPDLDRFLKKYAFQNQFRLHFGTTYVACRKTRILGYATVAAGQMELESLPKTLSAKLPKYPIPILRLARLAVDEAARKKGVGRALLRFVLKLSLRMAGEFGCAGVVADVIPVAVGFYEALGFEPIELIEGASGIRPSPQPMFLSMREIRKAVGE